MYYLYDKNGKCNCKVYHTRRTEHVKNLFHPVYYIIVYNEKHDILLKRKYVKKKHNIVIGERTAEDLKINIGCVYP